MTCGFAGVTYRPVYTPTCDYDDALGMSLDAPDDLATVNRFANPELEHRKHRIMNRLVNDRPVAEP